MSAGTNHKDTSMSTDTPTNISTGENHAQFINGLSEVAEQYDAFIIDIFGVIHDGIKPFANTNETVKALRDAGKDICLLSNSPRRTEHALDYMQHIGVDCRPFDHIMTSGEATYKALRERNDPFHAGCGNDCWFIGNRFYEDLGNLDLNFVDGPENASFILNCIPGTEDSEIEILKQQLAIAVSKDMPMVCANPDLVVNIGDSQHECAGTFAALYEQMGGRVVYHGKPHAPVYERCYDLLGRPDKSRICAIGDALHTDISGANQFGIDSIFNLVGIHWEEVQLDHAPGKADIAKIQGIVEKQPYRPTYTMADFSW